ncbi:MAG: flavin reductase family protein [Actinomycetota bacterium]|nr:flavin reductase family protein [Actinomycetota bacterium]
MGDVKQVGPLPGGVDPDEYDRRRRRVLWSMPSGLYVLGSVAGGRRNLMTLNWATQVATDPKVVAVSVEKGAVTRELVARGGVFALSILSRDDRALVRKFVKPLDDDGDPASLADFEIRVGSTGAPILGRAVAWLDCRVVDRTDCGSHTVFFGEVADCGQVAELGDVLRMEDTRMSYGG